MERDDGFLQDDPTLTRFQNVVRYMKQHPDYLPPNEWPKAMVLFMLSNANDSIPPSLIGMMFMPLDKFEGMTEENLFKFLDTHPFSAGQPKTDVVCFIPSVAMPDLDSQQREIEQYGKNDPAVIANQINYMVVNGWYISRQEQMTAKAYFN